MIHHNTAHDDMWHNHLLAQSCGQICGCNLSRASHVLSGHVLSDGVQVLYQADCCWADALFSLHVQLPSLTPMPHLISHCARLWWSEQLSAVIIQETDHSHCARLWWSEQLSAVIIQETDHSHCARLWWSKQLSAVIIQETDHSHCVHRSFCSISCVG